MPAPLAKLAMSRPLIVLPPEPGARSNPSPVFPAALISMIGVLEYPAWLVPSISTGSVIAGKAVWTLIVYDEADGMIAKPMTLLPGLSFASRIAWRHEPVP